MVRTRACTRERGWVNEVRAGLRRAACPRFGVVHAARAVAWGGDRPS